MPTELPADLPPVDLARVDAVLRSQDGRLGDLGESGRNFARIINRLQRVIRMVQASEEKTFGRTLQRWRLIDAPYMIELGTERRGAGQFALIARWAPDAAPDVASTPRPSQRAGSSESRSPDSADREE